MPVPHACGTWDVRVGHACGTFLAGGPAHQYQEVVRAPTASPGRPLDTFHLPAGQNTCSEVLSKRVPVVIPHYLIPLMTDHPRYFSERNLVKDLTITAYPQIRPGPGSNISQF